VGPAVGGFLPCWDGISLFLCMLTIEDLCEPEWAAWYRMTPRERWAASGQMWDDFLALGGSTDPEPDHQSPFYDAHSPRPVPSDGRPGLRVIRRSGV
jgi:hypothetical protein